MGFDLHGITHRSKKGKFLSINVWGWRPIWHILCNHTESLTEEDRIKGHINDGHKIDGEKHHEIQKTLKWLLEKRPRRIEYEARPSSYGVVIGGRNIESLDIGFGEYNFSWEILSAFYSFCFENDGFQIR